MVLSTDERRSRHRRTHRDGTAGAATIADRVPPSPADPSVALGQRACSVCHADERADDLQRSPAPLLGAVRRQFGSPMVVVPWPPCSRLGDYPINLQFGSGAPLAPRLRLDAVGG